ncbi:MAG: hypothetical protein AB1489_00700 [Acidobacteriota bacterium]
MNKSSWVMICALLVAVAGLLSAVLLAANLLIYGLALLALALAGGTAAILLAAQSILNNLEQIHKGMVVFNPEESREFVAAVDSTYASERAPKTTTASAEKASHISVPQVSTSLSTAVTHSQSSLAAAVSKESYQPVSERTSSPLITTSTPALAPPPIPSNSLATSALSTTAAVNDFETTLGHGSASEFAIPPTAKTGNVHISTTTVSAPIIEDLPQTDDMETTQSYLPSELQGGKKDNTRSAKSAELSTATTSYAANTSPEATIGFAAGFSRNPSGQGEPTKTSETKARAKLVRKRYNTFAGLSLHDIDPADNISPHKEDILTPPPPPPPPPSRKETNKKRYSTFAGLSLMDRGSSKAAVTSAQTINASPTEPPRSNRLVTPAPNTTNIPHAKPTESLAATPERNAAPAVISSRATSPASSGKMSRKRYQTFMGLSLSKTPQPLKRLDEPSEQTAPLQSPISAVEQSSYNRTPAAAPQTAINKGQMGNLVDGFCSLCGSPQAAGTEYSGVQSEPEFCWYCGAKLKMN